MIHLSISSSSNLYDGRIKHVHHITSLQGEQRTNNWKFDRRYVLASFNKKCMQGGTAPGGGGGGTWLTYGEVPLENLKSYPVPESNF